MPYIAQSPQQTHSAYGKQASGMLVRGMRKQYAFFHKQTHRIDDIRNASRHLQELLSIKSNAEYGEKLMTEKSATLAKKHAGRLFDFVQIRIQNY